LFLFGFCSTNDELGGARIKWAVIHIVALELSCAIARTHASRSFFTLGAFLIYGWRSPLTPPGRIATAEMAHLEQCHFDVDRERPTGIEIVDVPVGDGRIAVARQDDHAIGPFAEPPRLQLRENLTRKLVSRPNFLLKASFETIHIVTIVRIPTTARPIVSVRGLWKGGRFATGVVGL
jgi:hypothetical protein